MDDLIKRLRTLRAFLGGSDVLKGFWFGDLNPRQAGHFWWRSELKAMDEAAAALTEARAEIERLRSALEGLSDSLDSLDLWGEEIGRPEVNTARETARAALEKPHG